MDTHSGETRDERYLRGKFSGPAQRVEPMACDECGQPTGIKFKGLCRACDKAKHPERYPDG